MFPGHDMALPQALRSFESRPLYIRLAAPFIAGAVMVPALPPHSLWATLWFGFSAFYILLSRTQTKKEAFFYGWMFGFGYFVFGLSWIANALTVDGSTYSWVIPLAIAGLPALLSIFTGLASLLCRRLSDMSGLSGLLAFSGFISLFEWLRGHVFTGFPWNLYGYGWDGVASIAQTVSIFGVYGLTVLTVLWAAAPGFLFVSKGSRTFKTVTALILYGLLGTCFVWGHQRLDANPTKYKDNFILRIVQPSIPQSMKWNLEKAIDSFQRIAAASSADNFKARPDATVLMIWPETAVTQDVIQHPIALNVLKNEFSLYPRNFYLATGLLRWETAGGKEKFYNSIGIYDRNLNRIETYDKSHLVPFGEYIPFSRWIPANPMVATDGFESGGGPGVLAIPLGPNKAFTVSPTICYEVIFPGHVVPRGARPGLLLNVTNDGWYGDSAGPRQHLSIARFRAIEEGVPMARAANTGISAVIDPYGRYLWRSDLFAVTSSNISLPEATRVRTLYARFGDWLALALIGILCCAAFVGRGKQKTLD